MLLQNAAKHYLYRVLTNHTLYVCTESFELRLFGWGLAILRIEVQLNPLVAIPV